MDKEKIRDRVGQIKWFHTYELLPGVMTNGPGSITEQERNAYFKIPEDLSGKRVLDIGCADGYFTFLAESRGASVVAIDAWPHQGFFLAHEVRQSNVEFYQMDLYDLQPDTFGTFDIVFFMGVYYHLKNPILALERVASLTRELAIIESQITDLPGFEEAGVSRFYEHEELAPGDPTNWWVPNVPCLLQTVRAAGFPRVEFVASYLHNNRGIVHAYKGPRTVEKMLTEDIVCSIQTPSAHAEVSGTVQISGFAFSKLEPDGGIERIGVYLDKLDDPESEVGEAKHGAWQATIAARAGDKYGPVGFEFTWNTAGVTPGKHTIYILVEGKRGWHYSLKPITIKGGFPGKFLTPALRKNERTEPDEAVLNKIPSDRKDAHHLTDLKVRSHETLSPGELPPSLERKLSNVNQLGQSIGVSVSTQPGWLVADKVRQAFHNLVIYYVNMLARKQKIFNQAISEVLQQVAASVGRTEPDIEALHEEIITLHAEIQALQAKLEK